MTPGAGFLSYLFIFCFYILRLVSFLHIKFMSSPSGYKKLEAALQKAECTSTALTPDLLILAGETLLSDLAPSELSWTDGSKAKKYLSGADLESRPEILL